ncbi:MAG: heavy-metal-associated domain-containing protein [Bacteroidota bacterium]
MKTQLFIDNIKCGGCAGTIKRELMNLPHVSNVTVNKDEEIVDVEYGDEITIDSIKEKLFSLGYPEKNTVTGFTKIAANAKSYVSCAIGKINNEE